MKVRTVKSISRGDTLLRLTKSEANLYDFAVLAENMATGESVTVVYPAYIEADKAFRHAHKRARGEADDLAALMGIDSSKGW